MPIIEEFHHLLEAAPYGLKRMSDESALVDRMEEWLRTPQGTLIDDPGWGHNLTPFRHEPPGITLDVMLEISIMRKMSRDIANLQIRGIRAKFTEIDRCVVGIVHQFGTYVKDLAL